MGAADRRVAKHGLADDIRGRTNPANVGSVLVQPAQALTDLALGSVVACLARWIPGTSPSMRHWRTAFWWAAAAALGGFVHHGIIVRWPEIAAITWPILSVMVVVAVSYFLAATVSAVLGAGHAREFWILRSLGLIAYVVLAATGRASVTAILVCESLTMAAVLGLWSWAAYRRHPLAVPVLLAILASMAAAGTRALSPAATERVHLDPTSTYHLAQIVGMVLLFRAIRLPDTVSPRLSRSVAANQPD